MVNKMNFILASLILRESLLNRFFRRNLLYISFQLITRTTNATISIRNYICNRAF